MKIKIISLILLILFFSSCTKDNLDDIDYFAFGKAYGFCLENCATFFIIKDGNIYPDEMNRYLKDTLIFKSESLPVEKYYLAKKLIDRFPTYLTNNPDKTFGCPDCADQGGIHIEIKEMGQIKRWHFDTNVSNLPVKIQDYVQEISNVIDQLK